MKVLGVDQASCSGWAVIDSVDGSLLGCGCAYDGSHIEQVIRRNSPDLMVIESHFWQPRRKGLGTLFEFGGRWLGIWEALATGRPVARLRPKQWRAKNGGKDEKDWKVWAVNVACGLWPGVDALQDHNIAEAALIARAWTLG